MLDEIQKRLLREIADLHTVPSGAYNIRSNSKLEARNTTANIDIVSKTEKSGIDIYILFFILFLSAGHKARHKKRECSYPCRFKRIGA